MRSLIATLLFLPLLASAQKIPAAARPYWNWRHTGKFTMLTTPEGANLPASASVEQLPLVVRLHRDWFDFKQAKAGGEDVRFSDSAGTVLAYQIEEWDAVKGTASIWVRVPKIVGNSRRTIRMHGGDADVASESDRRAVFNESNGYLSVWHMGDPVRDEVGMVEFRDTGTTATQGVIGNARHLVGKQDVISGDKISGPPTGASPHISEAWFRPEKTSISIMAWGNEQAQGSDALP